MRKEFRGGVRATTLVAAVDSSTLVLSIATPTGWPDGGVGPFVVAIDRGNEREELVLCESRVDQTITVVSGGRGHDLTTAKTHDIGATVEHVLDAATLDEVNRLANVLGAPGEMYVFDGSDVVAVPAPDDDGEVLVADLALPGKMKWDGITGTALPLADGAVTTPKLADEAVTSAKLASLAVGSDKLENAAVIAAKLADGAVTNAKLRHSVARSIIGRSASSSGEPGDIEASADGQVLRRAGTTLGFGQVAAAGLAASAVTTDKIANTAVSEAKLAAGAVSATKLADVAVTTAKLANAAVSSAKIADGAVTNAKLGNNSVNTAKLASSAVGTTQLANSAVTEAKLDSSNSFATAASGWTQNIRLRRIGNTVWVSGTAARTGVALGSLTTAATIASAFRPAAQPGDQTATTSAGNIRAVRVTTGGSIQVDGINNGEVVTFNWMYTV